MGENNFCACEEVRQDRGFRHWGEVGGAKRELWTDLMGHERITSRFEVRRAYKFSAGSLEEKSANLWSMHGHSGAITPMKIDLLWSPSLYFSDQSLGQCYVIITTFNKLYYIILTRKTINNYRQSQKITRFSPSLCKVCKCPKCQRRTIPSLKHCLELSIAKWMNPLFVFLFYKIVSSRYPS